MPDLTALRAAHDRALRLPTEADMTAGGRLEQDGPLVRVVGWHRGFVAIPPSPPLPGADLDALIRRQREYFAARRQAVEWKTWGHDQPADLPARLEAAGFVAEDRETVMIGEAAALAAAPVLPPGVTLRSVRRPEDIGRLVELGWAVWNQDHRAQVADVVADVAAAPHDSVVFLAEAGDTVVAAGRVRVQPGTGFAGLWGGSTRPPWRRQGIFRALVHQRAQVAAERGATYVYVDASDDSRPILERLGLVAVTTSTPYVWSPASPEL